GSLPWSRLIGFLGSTFCFSGQADRAVELAQRFVAVEPTVEARTTYLYSGMYFVVLFSQGGLRQAANLVLERMEQIATTLENDVHILAPMQFSRATYLRSFRPHPQLQLTAAQEAAAA